MATKLLCAIWGTESPVFTVEFGPNDRVEKLRNVISKAREVDIHPSDVTIYWVKHEPFVKRTLAELIKSGALLEMYDYAKVPTKPEASVARRDGEDLSLKDLWRYSKLDQLQLLTPSRITSHLTRRLPFRVRVNDQHTAAKIFDKDGPEIRCDALPSLIDVMVMIYEAGLDEEDTKRSCQKFDDMLYALTSQICRANGIRLKVERKMTNSRESSGENLRSDLTVFCNDCLVLCGEERGDSAGTNTANTLAELDSKMKCWNPLFFGELPFILSYLAVGNYQKLSAFPQHSGSRRIFLCDVSSTVAIKVFYNLAFVVTRMTTLSKLTIHTMLSPFHPYNNKTGTTKLVDGLIQLTITRENYSNGGDYKRVVGIYKNLKRLNQSTETLQQVRVLKQTHVPSRGITVQLHPTGFYCLPENVDEVNTWLANMLHALRAWHDSGYYHAAIRWENMVYVPMHRIMQDPAQNENNVRPRAGYWMLVNMESSRRSKSIHESAYTTMYSCQDDLVRLGWSLDGLHREKFLLTHRLLWIRDKLLSARLKSDEVTAKKVLAMLHRTKHCRSDDLQTVASVLLSALYTPEMTAESVLVTMKELVPPGQEKPAEPALKRS